MTALRERRQNVAIQWILSHTDIPDNVRADGVADDAHKLPATVNCTSDALGTCRNLEGSPRFLYEDACSKSPSFLHRDLKRHEASALMSVRTGSVKPRLVSIKMGKHSITSPSTARSWKHLTTFFLCARSSQQLGSRVSMTQPRRKRQTASF